MKIVSIDTETFPIGPGEVIPKLVCCSFAQLDKPEGFVVTGLLMAEVDPELPAALEVILRDDDTILVGHNLAYDLGVIRRRFLELKPLIWRKLEQGLCTDTKIREKLLNLSTFGALDYQPMPEGAGNLRLAYSLAALEKKYLGLDRSEDKAADSWRVNYHFLAGKPADQYPPEAYKYAVDDAIGTLKVWTAQRDAVATETGYASLSSENYQTAVDFALFLITAQGMPVDHAEVNKIKAMLAEELSEDKIHLLYESGILRRGTQGRPRAGKRTVEALALLGLDHQPTDWTPYKEALEANGFKFTAPTKESRDMKQLAKIVTDTAITNGITIKLTETNEDVSTRDDVIEELEQFSPVLAQYGHRQRLQKLVTNELDAAVWQGKPVERIHFGFEVMVETGRTSSKGGGKAPLYPARNGQNVDPRARPMFIPEDGCLLASIDYRNMELFTTAQKCLDLLGKSHMAELLNAGVDLHAYMGAQLALRMHPEFRAEAVARGIDDKPLDLYETFKGLNGPHQAPEIRAFYKHWRTFAKPTNLGYPGGLGPDTFVTYAKGTFGVVCTRDQATEMREIWRATFPEVKAAHDYISANMKDPNNPIRWDPDEEREIQPFCYTTKLGMHRANASFCATANGVLMQSPGAEGAKWGMFQVQKECDLLGLPQVRVVNFIHDEILLQVGEDLVEARAQVALAAGMMESCHQKYCPDVLVKTESKLMRRWYKEAEPVLDADGRLLVWEPKK